MNGLQTFKVINPALRKLHLRGSHGRVRGPRRDPPSGPVPTLYVVSCQLDYDQSSVIQRFLSRPCGCVVPCRDRSAYYESGGQEFESLRARRS
jgi:hypothetical protein